MAEAQERLILLVDDDKAWVDKVAEALSKEGYGILMAYNGEEALAAIQDERPDLIILDIIMPKMGGLAFFDRITPPNHDPSYPVLVVTVRENLRELFDHLPVEGFIAKPVEPEVLVKKVKEIFTKKKIVPTTTLNRRGVLADVLIIDDDFEMIKKAALPFLDHGYTITAAKTAKEAVERIIHPEPPDLVLIKQGMPENPEFTIIYHLKGIPAARHTSIVVYTPDLKKVDVMVESEIVTFVGEKNFLELSDPTFFFKRCEWILAQKKQNAR